MLTRRRGEDGFTLIELLVTVVILGVIAGPLAGAIIAYLHNAGDATTRFTLSHDAQISSAYFARDVASVGVRDYSTADPALMQSVETSSAALNKAPHPCGTTSTKAVLRLLSDDWTHGGTTPAVTVIAYYLSGTNLHRIRCSGSATPASDTVVAHNVNASTVSIACDGDPTRCESARVPQRITLKFSVGTAPDDLMVTLTGDRRQT